VTVVYDDNVDRVIEAIQKNANSTSKGIITVSDVAKVVKI
jgi:nitrogen regulatory protein PII